jgi:NADPH:quinone reductase-like Zn-dependent oxidoreductase
MSATQALQFNEFGDPTHVISLVELEVSPPSPGQVTVEMEASPIDPTDLGFVRGAYGLRPSLPRSGAGQSGIGRIAAVGPGVETRRVGERVVVIPTGERLVWQDRLTVDLADVATIDSGADPIQLSTIGVNQMTAYQLLAQPGLSAGDWVAQTAANSAVGSSVIALASSRELRTLNVVRRPEAVPFVDNRADAVLVDGDDLTAEIATTLEDNKLALVLAATGGPAITTLATSLADGGTVVSYGAVDGQPITLPLPGVIYGGLHVHGFWIVNWIRRTPRDQVAAAYQQVARSVADGTLRTEVAATYPLSEYAKAFEQASQPSSDGQTGKVFFTFER